MNEPNIYCHATPPDFDDKHSGQPTAHKLVKLMREMDKAIQLAEGRSE